LRDGRLKAGDHWQGFLIGTAAAGLLPGKTELNATVWIQDLLGFEYPYPILIKNRPL
jgi:hypothetical protein